MQAYFAGLRATISRFIMVCALVANTVWWTTDRAVMGHLPGVPEAFVFLRVVVTVACTAALLILWRAKTLVGVRLWACIGLLLTLVGASGYGVGVIGPLSTPWFHCLYPLVFATMPIPFGFRTRLAVTTLMGTTLILGYAAAPTHMLSDPFFPMAIGYTLFMVGVALAFGHRVELITRDAFERRLALEASEAIIRAQREGLRAEVDERTRELRLLAGHLDAVADSERERIASALHDDLGQCVSALQIAVDMTLRRHGRDPASIRGNLSDLRELTHRIAQGTRDAVTRLRPRLLDDRGLVEAARWLADSTTRHTGLPIECVVEGDSARLEPQDADVRRASPVVSAAFRVLQESLTNVLKHANATRAAIRIRVHPDRLQLEVEDDGQGLTQARPGAMGLITLRERARALGGEFGLGKGTMGGVLVTCTLPLESP